MKALTMRLTGFLALLVAFVSFSSFGSVAASEDGRTPQHRVEDAAAKKANKKAARVEARQEQLRSRIETAKTTAQKDRLQRQLDRTDRPKKAEVLGTLALAFGATGLGLIVVSIVMMFLPVATYLFFWLPWIFGFMFSLAGMVLGIIGKNLNDDKTKANIGMILGIVGLALWLISLILFFVVVLVLLAGI